MDTSPDLLAADSVKLSGEENDGIILVVSPDQKITSPEVQELVEKTRNYDAGIDSETLVLPLLNTRVVYAPTGYLDPDYDDVRALKVAAAKGVKRALKAGLKTPLLILEEHPRFENAQLVTLLGVLEALYTPLQVRESGRQVTKFTKLSIFTNNPTKTTSLIKIANILETGRRMACDIGDSDPERMSPPNVEAYIKNHFDSNTINMKLVTDVQDFTKDYPLFEAVNRAASGIPRHQGRIIYLDYTPKEVKETLFLVGKGVTYDTGGIDVKINGAMVGMSRDKCGAAAVAGFMKVVELIKPKNLKVVAALSLVRNSIGSNGYVADEVITARSGARVRVVNTDAEGRMVMADVLCKFKEDALSAVNPHLYTIATLTGHAHRTVGEGYSIVLDNGPAKKAGHSKKLQDASDLIGDPFEVSTIRKEDFATHKGVMQGDDVVQALTQPSTQCSRGHQGPAAFLILASGLNKHGSGSNNPLKYSHLDIAASAGSLPDPATGSPVLALAKTYLL